MALTLDADPCETTRAACRTKSTRVLHLINGEHYAGAERVQDLLGVRLAEHGYDVAFACLKPDQFPALRRSAGQPLYRVPMRGKWDLSPIASLVRQIRTDGYSLIHTHTARSALIGSAVARWAGVPLVHHVHSPAAAESTHRWRNRANALGERFCLRAASAVIAVSAAMGEYALGCGIPEANLTVVHNGVPGRAMLSERDPPSGTWTLGTVALFRPRKGIEVLLAALAELRRLACPVRLRAVGTFESPEYEREIKSLAASLEIADLIDWRGFRRDVETELSAMDLFVLPSLFGEGLPMVVLEAMAAGVPVVATRVSGIPEAVRDRIDGLLVPPSDPSGLASAVREFVEGGCDWVAARQAAHDRQLAQFSDASMAAGVADVYRKVLA